jgi:hypothetical protein
MKYLIAVFYRYYNDGSTRTIAYGMALMVVIALLTFNIASLLIIFYGDIGVLNLLPTQKGKVFLISLSYLITSSLLLRLFYPPQSINSYIANHNSDDKGWLAVLFIVATILLFSILCASR